MGAIADRLTDVATQTNEVSNRTDSQLGILRRPLAYVVTRLCQSIRSIFFTLVI